MNSAFQFEVKNKSFYDFLCGRVKILETYLIDEATLKELKRKDFQSFVETLESYPYKNFITGNDFNSIRNAIFKRREFEFGEFSKFELSSFINVFFRSANYFLKVKKAYLGYEVEKDFVDFLESGFGNYPKHLYDCFVDLKSGKYKDNQIPLVIDVYYLKFLLDYAAKTNSPFIEDYYKDFAYSTILLTLMRNYNFFNSKFLTEDDFNSVVKFFKDNFPQVDFLKKIFDLSTFEEFIKSSKNLYGERNLLESWESLPIDVLKKTIEKGKFLNEGIEPIFVYLLRLNYEVSVLQKLAYALYYGLNPDEISELEFEHE